MISQQQFAFAFINSIGALGGFFGPVMFGYLDLTTTMITICLAVMIGVLLLMTLKNRISLQIEC